MMSDKTLGQRVKHYRKLNDMTQQELAAAVGLEAVHIANIENGRKGISLDKLMLICRHFNIEVSDIVKIKSGDETELKQRLKDDISNAVDRLDTNQLTTVKAMVCSLVP